MSQSLLEMLGRAVNKADIIPGAYVFMVENRKQRKKHIYVIRDGGKCHKEQLGREGG